MVDTLEATEKRVYPVIIFEDVGAQSRYIGIGYFDGHYIDLPGRSIDEVKSREIEAFKRFVKVMSSEIESQEQSPQESLPKVFDGFKDKIQRYGIDPKKLSFRHSYDDVLLTSEETGLSFDAELDFYCEADPTYGLSGWVKVVLF